MYLLECGIIFYKKLKIKILISIYYDLNNIICMTKLYLFKALNAEKCIILKKISHKKSWQMILWDINTDNITEGSIIFDKDIWIDGSAISPDGQYFYYSYDMYNIPSVTGISYESGVVLSRIPDFYPLLVSKNACNRFQHCRFDEKSGLPVYNQFHELEQCTSQLFPMIKNNDTIILSNPGLITKQWTDYKGRCIIINDNVITCDNNILYDGRKGNLNKKLNH
jgi:hypothetical protein